LVAAAAGAEMIVVGMRLASNNAAMRGDIGTPETGISED
jgi:hypothetical protein